MERDRHIAIYEKYLSLCNEHRFDDLGEFVALEVGGSTSGLTNYIAGCRRVIVGFPDYQWSLQQMVVDGDWLAARLSGQGTHKGVFRGVQPTGRSISIQEIAMYRFADGKIAECWGDLHSAVRDELISGC